MGGNGVALIAIAAFYLVALLLEEAANSLEEHPQAGTEPNRAAAARAALGLEPGAQGKPLRGRKGQAGRVGTIARWLVYEPASVFKARQDGRSAFDALVDDVAEYVLRREIAHRVTEQRLAQQARRPPLESAMQVDWLHRFEGYYRLWAHVSGLGGDITMGLDRLRADDPQGADYFTRKALYYLARFLRDLEVHTRERGGLWVLPDPKAEQTVADAVWMLRKPTPLTEIDESMLRLAIAGWEETATFVHATHTDTALKRIVDAWAIWMQACQCEDLEQPNEDCSVHQCLRWTSLFMSTLDAQWDMLADWYTATRHKTAVEPA